MEIYQWKQELGSCKQNAEMKNEHPTLDEVLNILQGDDLDDGSFGDNENFDTNFGDKDTLSGRSTW